MEGLKLIPYIALLIAVSGIIIGAAAVSLSKFQETTDNDGCYNSSYKSDNVSAPACTCQNSTSVAIGAAGEDGTNLSAEGWAICKAIESQGELAEQLPTVAVIGVMVIIISIIAGVFVYLRYFQ